MQLPSGGSHSGSFTANQDSLLSKLKQQEKFKEMSLADQQKYQIEAEGDVGFMQQVSGGFGDTKELDESQIRMLV